MSRAKATGGTITTRLGSLHRVLELPEVHILVFAFLLNFVWEFLQTPFFQSLPQMPHWRAVKLCTLAAIGDAAIMFAAFWCVAAAARTRRWILNPASHQLAGFVGLGLAVTVALEWAALSTGRWEYSGLMLVIPLVGIGLLPLLQWLFLPPLAVWFVQRQLT